VKPLKDGRRGEKRPEGTVHEYGRAIECLLSCTAICHPRHQTSHVRTFRDALQLVPKARKGSLRSIVPELSDYGARIRQ